MTQVATPLAALDGKPLGVYSLRLADARPGSKSGWRSFRLLLASSDATFSAPLIDGVFSTGGRGVAPWIEVIEYHPRVKTSQTELDLPAEALDLDLFGYLSGLIPSGGHLMLACESPEHEATYRLLMRRVPPVLTPLGRLLFDCGFHSVRFFYLAEGGWEGPQKLWAEKALDPETARRGDETTARDVLRFLAEPTNARLAPECTGSAVHILRQTKAPGTLGELVESLLQECSAHAAHDPRAFFACAERLLAGSPLDSTP